MLVDPPRYLIAFHPKLFPHYFADVLIVGGGLAGLRAAIEIDPKLRIVVVTKDELQQSSSTYAQGGIAGVIDPNDRFEDHIADTLNAGCGLCDAGIVEMVIREAPQRINELMRWGADFDEEAGELDLGREGGHSHDRIVHASDKTGKEVMRAVINWTYQQRHVSIWENAFTLDLLTANGVCRGAIVSHPERGISLIWAKQTILCTGGAGQLYRETSNPEVATGDGIAIGYRAGAEVRDLEFMQFHPTMLYIAGSNRTLITEAIRGAGAHLLDCNGHRFMGDYDERLELAPRDVVSHSIVQQMDKSRHPNVYLDLRHLDAEWVKTRFAGLVATCSKFGIDIAKEQIPVRPGAHYSVGGLTVDAEGRSTLPGLWAAGEATSSGLHGANRLASNSLLEGMVFGAHAGHGASCAAAETPDDFRVPDVTNPAIDNGGESLDIADIRNSLQSLMWRSVGVHRTRDRLTEAAQTLDKWCRYALPRQFCDVEGWELQNMLTVARIMVDAALSRDETRGVHQRTDFPQSAGEWCRHLSYERSGPHL